MTATFPRMKPLLFAFLLSTIAATSTLAQSPAAAIDAGATIPPKERKPWELEWAYLSKYRDANVALGLPSRGERRVVFMGDSITEAWGNLDPKFFARKGYVDRGIGGQTTSQMLVRFRQDVIMLKPSVVVILGGTNDIAQNGGLTTLEAIEENLQSMVELARINGFRVVLSSVLPVLDYPWKPGLQPADKIVALNRWIGSFCARNNIVYVDYYPSMVDGRRALKAELTFDGVHPNPAGYAVMDPLAEKAIHKALK
jgi:lysophospholipase L1-like esterase